MHFKNRVLATSPRILNKKGSRKKLAPLFSNRGVTF
jgi:hypothetical protein